MRKAIVLVCMATFVLHGQDLTRVLVTGTVADPSEAMVPGAVLKFTNRASGELVATTSDHNGKFRVASLAPGKYDVAAESPGFKPFLRSALALAPGEKLDLDVVLQISTLSEQVTVTAKAPRGEGTIETSSRNAREVLEIREVRESAAKDVGEAIAGLDGVWKIRKAGIANDVVLRGFQQGNINILIDGQRIYGACPGHMDPSAYHVDFAEIETVEVTKGPFDIRNQGSLGGAVNVISRRHESGFHLRPNLGAGSFGFYNPSLAGSFSTGRVYGFAGYSYRRSDPYTDGSGRSFTQYANYTPAGRSNAAFDIGTAWLRTGLELARNQSMELSYTRQSGGLALYPALQMDALYDNADRLNAN